MSWHILGGGSLGCLWAARLQRAGQAMRLLLRPDALQQLQARDNYLIFTDLQGNKQLLPVAAETAHSDTPIERLILATKAHAAANAIAGILPRLQTGSPVLLLQNGIGSQQEVAALLPQCRVLAASSTEGAWLQGPFDCVHAGSGQTLIGDLQPGTHTHAPDWLPVLQQTGIHCSWTDNIQPMLWRKLAINCLINPLTVIHQCRNGELAQHAGQISSLATELEHLLQAARQPSAAQNLAATAQQVIHSTAANRSSMLQDVQQRRRTEISYITGFALQQCQQLGLDCPQLTALHRQLQQHLRQLGLPDN